MKTLNLEEIVINNSNKSNEEIALEFNVSKYAVSAKRTWLIRKGIIQGDYKPKTTINKKERKENVLNKLDSNYFCFIFESLGGLEKGRGLVSMMNH